MCASACPLAALDIRQRERKGAALLMEAAERAQASQLPGLQAGARLSPGGTALAACDHDGRVTVLHRGAAGWVRADFSAPSAGPDAFAWLAEESAVHGHAPCWLVVAGWDSITLASVAERSSGASDSGAQPRVTSTSTLSLAAAARPAAAAAAGPVQDGASPGAAPPGAPDAMAPRCRPFSVVADARHGAVALLQHVRGAGAGACRHAPLHLVATVFVAGPRRVARAPALPLCVPSACAAAGLGWQGGALAGRLLAGLELSGRLTVWDWRRGGAPLARFHAADLPKVPPRPCPGPAGGAVPGRAGCWPHRSEVRARAARALPCRHAAHAPPSPRRPQLWTCMEPCRTSLNGSWGPRDSRAQRTGVWHARGAHAPRQAPTLPSAPAPLRRCTHAGRSEE